MLVQDNPPIHLTYCLNIHPGESWAENFAAIGDKALAVRDRVGEGRPFGLGLRLSAAAAAELSAPETLAEFKDFLSAENLYVFTINGFPYGRFHNTAVKEAVYSPDWRTPERLAYTNALADILAALLPEGVEGSISTVPGSYKAWITSPDDVRAMVENLAKAAWHLAGIRQRTGRMIRLALEPEPDCYVQTTEELIRFLSGQMREHGLQVPARRGATRDVERAIRDHLGICLDTAHAAVQFEDLGLSLASLARAGVAVGKIQLSSALRLKPTPEALERLKAFCDPVYLHQVRIRSADGRITGYPDLPQALAAFSREPTASARPGRRVNEPTVGAAAEWRVHFHVPLFFRAHEHLESTSSLLLGEFGDALRAGACWQLEIETYTFDVLPGFLRRSDVADSIAAEYLWVRQNLLSGARK